MTAQGFIFISDIRCKILWDYDTDYPLSLSIKLPVDGCGLMNGRFHAVAGSY